MTCVSKDMIKQYKKYLVIQNKLIFTILLKPVMRILK